MSDRKFDHDPVSVTLQNEKKKYRLTTFNGGTKGGKSSADNFKQQLQLIKSETDIICLQELPESRDWSHSERPDYHFHFSRQNNETAIMAKKSKFERFIAVEEKSDQDSTAILHKDIYNRQCTAYVKDKEGHGLVVISWHGRFKVNEKGTPKKDRKDVPEEKRKDFVQLLTYAKQMRKIYSAAVIIGGDFNFRADNASCLIKKEDSISLLPAGKQNSDIDYFIYLCLLVKNKNDLKTHQEIENLAANFKAMSFKNPDSSDKDDDAAAGDATATEPQSAQHAGANAAVPQQVQQSQLQQTVGGGDDDYDDPDPLLNSCN